MPFLLNNKTVHGKSMDIYNSTSACFTHFERFTVVTEITMVNILVYVCVSYVCRPLFELFKA